MSNKTFVHLHTHTGYSILDGMSKVEDLAQRAHEHGAPALAITDHGTMGGILSLALECERQGIKPIPGIEFYHTADRMAGPKRAKGEKGNHHLTALAVTTQGYHNLLELSSKAQVESKHGKWAFVDDDLLSEHGEGIILTSGCMGSKVYQLLMDGKYEEARAQAAAHRDIVGRDHYFIELMNHGIQAQYDTMGDLLRLSKDLGVELLATNDSHYTNQEDALGHDTLLCVQTGKKLSDEDRFRFSGDHAYYMKSPGEMWDLFPEIDFPGACDNTMRIAEECDVHIPVGEEYLLPKYDLSGTPELESITVVAKDNKTAVSTEVLRNKVTDQAKVTYGDPIPDDVQARLDHELAIIDNMGFPDYFLILSDIVEWAHDHGINTGPARGSAAGSLVTYMCGITSVDPLKYDLLFERFLNPHRAGMPDIDVDFDPYRSDEVIQYVVDKYGADHVSLIATYGFLKVKSSIKDAARAMGYPPSVSTALSDLIPAADMTGWKNSLGDYAASPCPAHVKGNEKQYAIWKGGSDFRDEVGKNPAYQDIVERAELIEGCIRTTGEHPSGVIVTPGKLWDYMPVRQKGKKTETSVDLPVSEWDMAASEKIGALKFDFLKIVNLTIIDRTLQLIKEDTGKDIDLGALTFDDPDVYAMLARGESAGVFQLESDAAQQMLRQVGVDGFHDLYNISAINRPGPLASGMDESYALRKRGAEAKTLISPTLDAKMSEETKKELAPVLEDSYNLLVMQEQIMLAAQIVAGYSMAEADNFRRVVSKKKEKDLKAMQPEFFRKGMERGNSEEFMQELWDIILPFSDYCFNKSHAVGYAYLSYHTAWLKRHYTAHYTAACVDYFPKEKVPLQIASARSLATDVSAPNVNRSEYLSTAKGDRVFLGLGLINGIGESVVNKFVDIRKEGGEFTSFDDFVGRVQGVFSESQIESLVKVGAFSDFTDNPRALAVILPDVFAQAKKSREKAKKTASNDLVDLFGGFGDTEDDDVVDSGPVVFTPIPKIEPWDDKTMNGFAREKVGFILGDHPCAPLRKSGLPKGIVFPDALTIEESGRRVKVLGLCENVEKRVSQKGNKFCTFTLDGGGGSVSAVIFNCEYLPEGEVMVVEAKVEEDRFGGHDDSVKLVCDSYDDEVDVDKLVSSAPRKISATERAVKDSAPAHRRGRSGRGAATIRTGGVDSVAPKKKGRRRLNLDDDGTVSASGSVDITDVVLPTEEASGTGVGVSGNPDPVPDSAHDDDHAGAESTVVQESDAVDGLGGSGSPVGEGDSTPGTIVVRVKAGADMGRIAGALSVAITPLGSTLKLEVAGVVTTAPFTIDVDVVDWGALSTLVDVVGWE